MILFLLRGKGKGVGIKGQISEWIALRGAEIKGDVAAIVLCELMKESREVGCQAFNALLNNLRCPCAYPIL